MTCSMTAFSRVTFESEWGRGTWELRSVNHRYAEVQTRLPEDFRGLENAVRERALGAIQRGKLDCTLRLDKASSRSASIKINEQAARELIEAVKQVNSISGQDQPISPVEILRWPGVVESDEPDSDAASGEILSALGQALKDLVETRQREGSTIRDFMLERLDGVREHLVVLEQRVPEIIANIRTRQQQRIAEFVENARCDVGLDGQ